MKAITIIQPWATLIALGEKRFETRGWTTKYRGPLSIHAGKRFDKEACRQEPIRSTLAKHGYTEHNLPSGVILAKSELADCFCVVKDRGDSAVLENGYIIEGLEYKFGNYSVGRYAWELVDVMELQESIPAKGQLGLWGIQ